MSKRDVDPKRTRKAMRVIRKLAEEGARQERIDPETGEIIQSEPGVDYSNWEQEFLGEVEQRLEKYGSAFNDLSKGRPDEALSLLQSVKLKEIAQKAKKQAKDNLAGDKPEGDAPKPFKPRKGLQTRKPLGWKKRQANSRKEEG